MLYSDPQREEAHGNAYLRSICLGPAKGAAGELAKELVAIPLNEDDTSRTIYIGSQIGEVVSDKLILFL